jgi:hypothetical protein
MNPRAIWKLAGYPTQAPVAQGIAPQQMPAPPQQAAPTNSREFLEWFQQIK